MEERLMALMAINRSSIIQENKVLPLKVFLDHWAVVNLLEKPSFAAQRNRLVSLCKNEVCVLTLTIWYVHEALRDGNKDRA